MPESPNLPDFPKEVIAELQATGLRVTQGVPAFRALKAVLTPQEWRRVERKIEEFFPSSNGGSHPSEAGAKRPPFYAIRKLMELRKSSQPRAILELGRGLNFLTDVDYQRLLREIGEAERKPARSKLPVWNRETGTLQFEGSEIRKVRSPSVARHATAILDTFEGHRWPSRIANPIGETGQTLHDAVKALNRGLKKISFHVEGDGWQISWRRR
jgi:hypothetical protein